MNWEIIEFVAVVLLVIDVWWCDLNHISPASCLSIKPVMKEFKGSIASRMMCVCIYISNIDRNTARLNSDQIYFQVQMIKRCSSFLMIY